MAATTFIDVTVGTGRAATDGTVITVKYTGQMIVPRTPSGTETRPMPAPLAPNETIECIVGSHFMIEGWNVGVLGMKVGGKRTITIPPEEGYRNENFHGLVPAGSTLVFEVELVAVRDAPSP